MTDQELKEWTNIHEALARAYVQGWYHGRDGKLTDEGKIPVAKELASSFVCRYRDVKLVEVIRQTIQTLYQICDAFDGRDAADVPTYAAQAAGELRRIVLGEEAPKP